MSPLRLSTVCALVCMGALGCQREDLAKKIGPASGPVIASLNAMGGVEAWRTPPTVRTRAILTVYSEKGQTYTNVYHLDMDLRGRTMRAEADLPNGSLTARINLDGRSRLSVRGQELDPALKDRVVRSLEQVLHLAGGPGNFVYAHETARSAQPARIAGRDFIRVTVGGDNSRSVAYYFDAVTCLLQYAASGADRPGGEGSIAAYTYRMLPGGRAFPQGILVSRIGQHVLIGDKPILEVTFTEVDLD